MSAAIVAATSVKLLLLHPPGTEPWISDPTNRVKKCVEDDVTGASQEAPKKNSTGTEEYVKSKA